MARLYIILLLYFLLGGKNNKMQTRSVSAEQNRDDLRESRGPAPKSLFGLVRKQSSASESTKVTQKAYRT
jgi:hypothetical protein